MVARDDDALSTLRAENADLRRRVAALEEALAWGVPYDRIFDSHLGSLVVFRPDGLVVAANARTLEAVGVPREAVVGRQNIFNDPEARAGGHTAAFERALQGEAVSMRPTPYKPSSAGYQTADERQLWIETIYLPIRGAGGVEYILGIHRDASAQQRAELARQKSDDLVRAIADNSPLILYVKDREGRYVLFNRGCEEFTGVSAAEALGKTDEDLFPQEVAAAYRASDAGILEAGKTVEEERTYQTPEGTRHLFATKFPVRGAFGEAEALCVVLTDITRVRRAEAENTRLQEEMLRAKEEMLRALSTPLIPIADRVVAMPLIGAVDRERAHRVIEAMLRGVAAHRAKIAILDVTGVSAADSEVASALSQAARAVGLLGAQVVLTGIRPEVAQALVSIGVDLGGVVTLSTLQDGIAYALKRRS